MRNPENIDSKNPIIPRLQNFSLCLEYIFMPDLQLARIFSTLPKFIVYVHKPLIGRGLAENWPQ